MTLKYQRESLSKQPPLGQKWVKEDLSHPLQIAILIGDTTLVNYLINENSFNPKVKNTQGASLVCYAAHFGKIQVLDCLVNNHQLDIQETDDNGSTPLHYAAEAGNIKIFTHLVTKYNLDVKKTITPQHLKYK